MGTPLKALLSIASAALIGAGVFVWSGAWRNQSGAERDRSTALARQCVELVTHYNVSRRPGAQLPEGISTSDQLASAVLICALDLSKKFGRTIELAPLRETSADEPTLLTAPTSHPSRLH